MKTPSLDVLLILLFLQIISGESAVGQTAIPDVDKIIPPSPTAASLGKYGNIPVSLYTGTPEISIPLYEIKGRKLSVPISLSYHASGMKVDEIAGWVGSGWSLNAGGVITRSVVDQPDDHGSGYFRNKGHRLVPLKNDLHAFSSWSLPDDHLERLEYYMNVTRGNIDTEPDIFFFNFNGRSGKFIFDVDGKIRIIPHQNLVIIPESEHNNMITSWTIIDEQGIRYWFGTEDASEITLPLDANNDEQESFISSWYLKKVISPNDEDHIDFYYSDYSATYRYPVSQRKIGFTRPSWDDLVKYTITMISGKLLKSINFPGGNVKFETSDMGSFIGGTNIVLDNFKVFNETPEMVKSYAFRYSFFKSTGCGSFEDYLPPCKRIRLDKVIELDKLNVQTDQIYYFFYEDIPLPPRGSFSQDFGGFYNGKPNVNLIPATKMMNFHQYTNMPPSAGINGFHSFDSLTSVNVNIDIYPEREWHIQGADRNPDINYAKAGMLKKIVYPTGGFTTFEYELNDIGFYTRPPKVGKTLAEAIYMDERHDSASTTRGFMLLYPQFITIVPLFFVSEESEKTKPSNDSYIMLSKRHTPDEVSAMLLKYTFLDNMIRTSGWEDKIELWLDKGTYYITACSKSLGDVTRAIVYHNAQYAYDECYPVYSDVYKDTVIQAGHRIWIDDRSQEETSTFTITPNDRRLVTIDYRFYTTGDNPNNIQYLNYDPHFTTVSVTDARGKLIYLQRFFDSDTNRIRFNSPQRIWTLSGTVSLNLTPGEYTVRFRPRMPEECGMIRLTYNKHVYRNYHTKACGLRVRRVVEMDNQSDTLSWKYYHYTTTFKKRKLSSGVLLSYPMFYDPPEHYYYSAKGSEYLDLTSFPLNQYSVTLNHLGATQGSPVGYREVTIEYPDKGKSVHTFTSAAEYPDISNNTFPFTPSLSFDWKRGLPKDVKHYTASGKLRKWEEYSYNFFENDTVNRSFIPALKIAKKTPDEPYPAIGKYMRGTGWQYTSSLREHTLDINGENPVIKETTFEYDPSHLQLSVQKTTNSDGSVTEIRYTYPSDLPKGYSPANDSLVARHMISPVIKKEVKVNGVQTEGMITNYGLFHYNRLVLPVSTETWEGDRYRTQTVFDMYDSKGNLQQYHHESDIFHSIHWDRRALYPVIQVDNASFQADTSRYGNEALVTKYSYIPLVGIDSVTDPNGLTTTYHYDNQWRLDHVRDFENNIIERYCYHYKKYQGDTSGYDPTILPFEYSLAPDTITASPREVVRFCPSTLSVTGGKLGTMAQWVWYEGMCLGQPVAEGPSIEVSPQATTTYYVRAEGLTNITPCDSVTVTVIEPNLFILPRRVTVQRTGTGVKPARVHVNKTSCDQYSLLIKAPWVTLENKSEEYFEFSAGENTSAHPRSGSIIVLAGRISDTVTVFQKAAPSLVVTFSPSLIKPGTAVVFTARVLNGDAPYAFTWEKKNLSSTVWDTVRRSESSADPEDNLQHTAGAVSFDIRCTATTGGLSLQQTIRVMVME